MAPIHSVLITIPACPTVRRLTELRTSTDFFNWFFLIQFGIFLLQCIIKSGCERDSVRYYKEGMIKSKQFTIRTGLCDIQNLKSGR